MPVMYPAALLRTLTPSSTAFASLSAGVAGTEASDQMEHGQVPPPLLPTVTVTPVDGVSSKALSSNARLRMVTEPPDPVPHENVQLVVPVALFQVVPPSTDTSTPTTT